MNDLVDDMLKRAQLVREVLVCLLLAGVIVLGVSVSVHLADRREPLPDYCLAGDARAASEVCHPK